jgi:hypothetical protein
MWRNVFAVIAGVFGMMIVITVVEAANIKLFPPPPGLDLRDPAQVKLLVDSMPLTARVVVVAGWCLGAFAGAGVAVRIARSRRLAVATMIGALVAIGTIANSMAVSQPDWMTLCGVFGPLLMAWIAYRLAVTPEPVLPND